MRLLLVNPSELSAFAHLSQIAAVDMVVTALAGCAALAAEEYDVCLVYLPSGDDGLEMLASLRRAAPDAAFVVVASGAAFLYIRCGAHEHLATGMDSAHALEQSVRCAVERKRAEAALRTERNRLSDLARAGSDWYWECDADLRFTYFSEHWQALTGLSVDTLLGRSRPEVVREHAPAAAAAAHAADLTARRPFRNFEYEMMTEDGSALCFRISGVPVWGRHGEFVGYRGTGSEVSTRRMVEDELVASKHAAKQATVTKASFLANMSHELRTPLNAIIGFSEVIRDGLFGPLEARYSDYAADIHVSGLHLLDLINDILDASKIEAGKMTLSYEEVALDTLIAESVTLVRLRAQARHITIVRTSEMATIWVDRRAAKQCIVNLLGNAVKFAPDGGTVDIDVAVGSGAGGIVIAVRDNGPGIPERDIPRLAHPFEQVQDAVSQLGDRGTGLGLAITRALMELHGGRLTLESSVGHGTTASLWFPPAPAAA